MRCKACNVILEPSELRRKDSEGIHYDLCYTCLSVSVTAELDVYSESTGLDDTELGYLLDVKD